MTQTRVADVAVEETTMAFSLGFSSSLSKGGEEEEAASAVACFFATGLTTNFLGAGVSSSDSTGE